MRTNVAEDDAVLRGGDLDVGLDVAEVMGRQQQRLRLLHQLQVACTPPRFTYSFVRFIIFLKRKFTHLPSMVWLKALGAFGPYTGGLLQSLSCLVDVVTNQNSEKSSLSNYVDTAGSGVDLLY